jgi:hypothetical protein
MSAPGTNAWGMAMRMASCHQLTERRKCFDIIPPDKRRRLAPKPSSRGNSTPRCSRPWSYADGASRPVSPSPPTGSRGVPRGASESRADEGEPAASDSSESFLRTCEVFVASDGEVLGSSLAPCSSLLGFLPRPVGHDLQHHVFDERAQHIDEIEPALEPALRILLDHPRDEIPDRRSDAHLR